MTRQIAIKVYRLKDDKLVPCCKHLPAKLAAAEGRQVNE